MKTLDNLKAFSLKKKQMKQVGGGSYCTDLFCKESGSPIPKEVYGSQNLFNNKSALLLSVISVNWQHNGADFIPLDSNRFSKAYEIQF